MKRIISLVLAVVLVIGVLSACAPANNQPAVPPAAEVPAPGQAAPAPEPPPPPPAADLAEGSLIVATAHEPPSVAPARHNAVAGTFINRMTHNGLFRICYVTLDPIPDLVASYQTLSDTVWEFTIHEGIYFHNGEEMTAEDIHASFWFAREFPEAVISLASIYSSEVVDRYTIRVDTGTPNAMLLIDLAQQANFIQPKSLIDTGHDFTAIPIGSGPYQFIEWRTGDFITMAAFDEYFDEDRSPNIRDITWRFIPEGASRTIALEAGEIDFIIEVATPDIPRMEADPGITVFRGMGTGHNFMMLNNESPMFGDVNVRRAIDMAIDKEAVVEVGLDGLGTPTWHQVPIGFPGVSNEGINSFDPEGARALLAENNIDPSTVTFEIIASDDQSRRIGEVIQANLADIGIHVTIAMMDLATRLAVTATPDYEAAIGSFNPNSLIMYVNGVYHSSNINASNRTRTNRAEFDELIDRAVGETNEAARVQIFYELTRALNENTGQIPLFQVMVLRAFNSSLVAPELDANNNLNVNMMYWVQ
ncbi:MAG: ABC transporter substrate-binding protein [Defluviitaleaceae bacterium]|nr:ABC transporter substrate-binding protein [Defluviitaleaceae bacterium]